MRENNPKPPAPPEVLRQISHMKKEALNGNLNVN
jgi:hypothetical protein